ncbi:Aldehyde/histidinol dehydrogenase [Choanephora cucurbitarum]|nr:Aldehyde/histidinol dehydrogenase [Choanephora cucurbitarum]
MSTDITTIPPLVRSLRDTFQTGLTKDKAFRKEQLAKFKLFFKEKENEIIDVIYKDFRKHKLETLIGEIAPVVAEIEFMLQNLDRLAKTKTVKPQFKMNSMDYCTVRKEPKGVVLIIGSWNYPIHLLLLPVVGAIAAGNCVVMKPSEVASHTSDFIAKTLPDYLDKRAYRVVEGAIPETTALLELKFNHIFYTGNGMVGKIVMQAASKHLTPVTLELGGKSPVFVAPDANLHTAASRILWGKTFNAGQICVSPDYVMIQQDQAEEFIKHCKSILLDWYGQDPQQSDSFCRIINQRRFTALKGLLDKTDPSQIVAGGQTDANDLYIAPTVVYPVSTQGHPLMEQEIFGPILPVMPVQDMDEAIRIVNQGEAPLALYVFTDDKATHEKILDNTQSGTVVVNDVLMQVQELSMPFGGVGSSGMGSYHGPASFDTFTHERSTMIKSSGLENIMSARYPPYSEDKLNLFRVLTMSLPETFQEKAKSITQFYASASKVLRGSKKTKQ